MAARLTGLVILGLAAACGDGLDPAGPDAGGPLAGELLAGGALVDGTGFVELDDGADAELVPGSQGGLHVWINVRVHGVHGDLYLEREARRASDGALVLAGSRRFFEVPEDAMQDWWESPLAAPSFMCPAPVGIRIFDEPMTFTARLFDGDGVQVAQDTLTLVPRCPTGEAAELCRDLCDG